MVFQFVSLASCLRESDVDYPLSLVVVLDQPGIRVPLPSLPQDLDKRIRDRDLSLLVLGLIPEVKMLGLCMSSDRDQHRTSRRAELPVPVDGPGS